MAKKKSVSTIKTGLIQKKRQYKVGSKGNREERESMNNDLKYSIDVYGTVGIEKNIKKGEPIILSEDITRVEEINIKDVKEFLQEEYERYGQSFKDIDQEEYWQGLSRIVAGEADLEEKYYKEDLDPINEIVWQHGTSSNLVESIRKKGFVPNINQNWVEGLKPKENTIYLAREGNPFLPFFALNTCLEQYRKTGSGGKPVIVTVKLSEKYRKYLVPDEDAIERKVKMKKYEKQGI